MQLHHKSKFINLLGGLTATAVVVLMTMSFLGYLRSTYWLAEIFANFYLQYSWAFLLIIPLLIMAKRPVWLTLATFGFILNFVTLLPFYFQPTAQAIPINTSAGKLTVMHTNVNYHTNDFAPLALLVREQKPDVLVVVELPSQNYSLLAELIPEYSLQYHLPGRARLGMAFFVKPEFGTQFEKTYFSQHADYPSITARITTQTQETIQFALIHPPPPITERTQQVRNDVLLGAAAWAAAQTDPVVVLGDFNATSWSKIFNELLETGNLQDSRLNNGVQPSWPSFLPKAFRIPIDHVLVRDLTVTDRQILPHVGSDHLPVLVKLQVN
jgi:endonuclease/exonuclease/phosphatase (EEP) superfamily protein YafD